MEDALLELKGQNETLRGTAPGSPPQTRSLTPESAAVLGELGSRGSASSLAGVAAGSESAAVVERLQQQNRQLAVANSFLLLLFSVA